MNTITLLTLLAGAVLVVVTANQQDGGTHSMAYLGTSDGISYFVDDKQLKNWTDSKSICNDSGMQMAKITTSAQVTLLMEHVVTGNESVLGFWTAGRDAQSLQQFVWDDDLQSPNDEVLNLYQVAPIRSCLFYFHGEVRSGPCGNLCLVLCSVLHGA